MTVAGFIREATRGRNPVVLRIAIIAALGGFLFGYDTGVISGALLYIQRSFHVTQFAKQWIVGSLLIGAVAGAIVSGYAADLLSRKWTKVISGCIYVGAALASALAPSLVFLIGSRFVLGLAVGTASFVAPMYIAEHTPPRIRGGVVSFNQLMIVLGILVAYLADYALQGFSQNWRWMLGFGAVPGLALAIGMLLVPHTPRWLVQQGREKEATDVLDQTRGHERVGEELEEIKEVARAQRRFRWSRLAAPGLRPLVIIGLGLAIFQQIVGVNTVIYYSATILHYTGLNANKSVTEAIFVGVTNVVFTVVAVLLLDRVGRRVLLLIGTAGLTVALIALGFFFNLPSLQHRAPYMALASLVLYIAAFAIGLGPVFWLMISEIFPLRLRSKAMSVCTVANWSFNFLVSYFFLSLVSDIGKAGTFWLYAGLGVLAVLFFALRVPETKARSLEEIERDVGARDASPERAQAA